MKTYYLNRVHYSVQGTKKELRAFTDIIETLMNDRPEDIQHEDLYEMILSEQTVKVMNSEVGASLIYNRLLNI